jgi:hypothetical protein
LEELQRGLSVEARLISAQVERILSTLIDALDKAKPHVEWGDWVVDRLADVQKARDDLRTAIHTDMSGARTRVAR